MMNEIMLGQRKPGQDVIHRLSQHFKVKPAYFKEREPAPPPPPSPREIRDYMDFGDFEYFQDKGRRPRRGPPGSSQAPLISRLPTPTWP